MIDTQTIPAVAPETVTPLLPSEALRLGRLTRPVRGYGSLFGRRFEACALGAMLAGSGVDELADDTDGYAMVFDRFPALNVAAVHPTEPFQQRIGDTVVELNDLNGWSDDQIVAWLQELGL